MQDPTSTWSAMACSKPPLLLQEAPERMHNGTSGAHDAPSNKALTEPTMRVRARLMPPPTAFSFLLT